MPDVRAEVVQGTLEMLILKTLSLQPMHGWGISLRLRQISGEVFDVNQGSLYPALQRMLRRRLIKASWRSSDNNRRARYYELTAAGREELAMQLAQWRHSSGAVERVLRFSMQEA